MVLDLDQGLNRAMRPLIRGAVLALLLVAEPAGAGEPVPKVKSIPPGGIAYGPFRDSQKPGGPCPTLRQIREDMKILGKTTRTVRTYGVCNCLLGERILAAASEGAVKVTVGLWIDGDRSSNECELAELKKLFPRYKDAIAGVVVGNETLLRGDLPIDDLTAYINRVRKSVTVPVTTAETWRIWSGQDQRYPDVRALVEAANFIFVHIHPYWDGVHASQAVRDVEEIHGKLKATYPGKEIIIGEVGWPSAGLPNAKAVPSLMNQRAFVNELIGQKLPLYYFSAFDEKWKREPHDVGPHWGLFYSNRKPKHPAVQIY